METTKLKNQLLEIQQSDYRLPEGLDAFEAVKLAASSLGSSDGELRDELGFTILFKWLIEKHLLEGDQLKGLLKETLSEDKLYFKIGESESDSVFQRAFSSLLAALILNRDHQDKFLSQEEFQEILNRLVGYCKLEKDFRSYVKRKGWAHAPAHISDALDECVRNRFAGLSECEALWEGLQALIKGAPHVFDAEEDERIAIPLIAMVELGKVPISVLLEWLQKMANPKMDEKSADPETMRADLTIRINGKHVIRCLYMRMKEKSLMNKEEEEHLFQLEHKLNPNYFEV